MMAVVFAAMTLAVALAWYGGYRAALVCLVVGFACVVGLFLWEVYSPEYGFRMPWIDTRLDDPVGAKGV